MFIIHESRIQPKRRKHKIMKGVWIAFIYLLLGGYNMAYSATLSGLCKALAGETIVIGSKIDPIVEQFVPLDTAEVDMDGNFTFEFDLFQTQICRIPAGNIEATVVVAPNANYTIEIPRFEELTLAEKLNPFYIRDEVPAVVLTGDDEYLNAHWWFYEAVFAHAYQEAILGTLPGGTGIAPWQKRVDTLYSKYSNAAFQRLRLFRQEAFVALSKPLMAETEKMRRMDSVPVCFDNSAYWELFKNNFRLVWPDTESDLNLLLQLAIKSGKLLPLKEDLQKSIGLTNDSLMELIICKELYRVGVVNVGAKKDIADLLYKASSEFNSTQTRTIASNLARLLGLRIRGTKAPYVKFKEVSGLKIPTLLDGKYVYIAFGNSKLDKFQRQMPLLEAYQKMFKRDLLVLPVCIYQDSAEVAHFRSRYDIKMPLAYFENGDAIKSKFGLEGIPEYFLIDREGNIAEAPATSPEGKFEDLFRAILVKEKQQQRGNGIFGW